MSPFDELQKRIGTEPGRHARLNQTKLGRINVLELPSIRATRVHLTTLLDRNSCSGLSWRQQKESGWEPDLIWASKGSSCCAGPLSHGPVMSCYGQLTRVTVVIVISQLAKIVPLAYRLRSTSVFFFSSH